MRRVILAAALLIGASFPSFAQMQVGGQVPINSIPGLPLSVAGGGTGAITAAAARVALFPTPTNGNVLTGNGTDWVSAAAAAGGFPITLGSTSIASGSTNTALAGLTLTNSTIAGYLPLAGGTLTGHLLFTDGLYDIGQVGARPRNINASNEVLTRYLALQTGAGVYSAYMETRADGVIELYNAAGSSFGALNLGGIGAGDPAIRRNGAAINFRTANNSADVDITAAKGTFSSDLKLAGDTTGAGTIVGLGANSPATTLTDPYTHLKFLSSDGSIVWVPAFK